MNRKLGAAAALLTVAAIAVPPLMAQVESLKEALDRQTDEVKARYEYRHPAQTLEFFGIEPGMTVVEAMPGAGWYTGILLPYLGPGGQLIGSAESVEFKILAEYIDSTETAEAAAWGENWVTKWRARSDADSAQLDAFLFDSLPQEMHETADAVLFIRALHGLAPYGEDNAYLLEVFRDSFNVLKSGGIVGIVQHQARDDMSDEWASGENGYLKKSFIVDLMERSGFEFVGDTDINENSRDVPTADEFVWRLPPSLDTSEGNPELRAEMEAIGESNRMTLKFRKP